MSENQKCPNCHTKGYTLATMECEDMINIPCAACQGKGTVPGDKFVFQTYDDTNWLNEPSTSYYHGPTLDYEVIPNLKIITKGEKNDKL